MVLVAATIFLPILLADQPLLGLDPILHATGELVQVLVMRLGVIDRQLSNLHAAPADLTHDLVFFHRTVVEGEVLEDVACF